MNKPEFDDWLTFHFSRFTGVTAWLAKLPATAPPGVPTQKSVIDGWRDTLGGSVLDHCKTASQRLARGEEKFSERGFDCHPRDVRAIAAKLAGDDKTRNKPKWRIVDGEEVFECNVTCKDIGMLVLWHPTALKFFHREFANEPPAEWHNWQADPRWRDVRKRGQVYERCAVSCACQIGMKFRSSIPRYDANRHVLYSDDPRDAMKEYANTPAGGYGLDSEF